MWPFRKKIQETEVTRDSFGQWLRAQRPPWQAFFALSNVEREALAEIGDAYMLDLAVAIGNAISNPQAAQAGVAALAGDVDAEVALLRAAADGKLARLGRDAPTRREQPAMAGFQDRGRGGATSAAFPLVAP